MKKITVCYGVRIYEYTESGDARFFGNCATYLPTKLHVVTIQKAVMSIVSV
jgi:hypothetical protein